MAKRKIEFVPGAYYHIYNRGAHKISLFREDADYVHLLRLLKDYSRRLEVSVIAYCLMPNHYHWLVRQDGGAAARLLPQRVFNAYSHYFNLRYEHSGTLLEGPFHAIVVGNDEYLRQLCRYIHANPVLHGFAVAPDLWRYSNYQEWIGKRSGTLIDRKFVEDHFTSTEEYQAYVMSYLDGHVVLPPAVGTYLRGMESE